MESAAHGAGAGGAGRGAANGGGNGNYPKMETPIVIRPRSFVKQETFNSDVESDDRHSREEDEEEDEIEYIERVPQRNDEYEVVQRFPAPFPPGPRSPVPLSPANRLSPAGVYQIEDVRGSLVDQPRTSLATTISRRRGNGGAAAAESGRGWRKTTRNSITNPLLVTGEHNGTVHFSSMTGRPHDPDLPTGYLNGQYKHNSYFAIRLLRITELIVLVDLVALGVFYLYKPGQEIEDGSLNVGAPLKVIFSEESGCRPTVALAALMYHLFPAMIIMGLPASGGRLFEPFKRELRIDRGGRLQKVKRTIYLQVCEITGVATFIYTGIISVTFIYFCASGRIFNDCSDNWFVYVFCFGAVIMYWLTFVEITYFARFREHLKMQLGAFKESDQTGDVRAHWIRSRVKREKRRQHLKTKAAADGVASSIPVPPPPPRSQIVKDVQKRLFRGAQLGDLRLLRRTLRVAKFNLGDDFAREMYQDATMVFGMFGYAKKNPMHVAAYHGNIAAMELLYRAKLNVNAFDKVSRVRFSSGDLFWYMASFFIQKPVESADESHSTIFKTTLVTPLHCAVSTGRVGAVRWLLEHGADVNMCSKSSYRCESRLPPIFLADHPEIVRILLAAGANHLAIPDPGHMNTITVLQLAYLRENYAVAQVLEDWGGDVALTPLHAAAAMNDTTKIRHFLRKKVNPDCLGELGYMGLNKRTPLHWAAINGARDAVEILLDAKADANFQDAHGRTPLHWAARVNRLDIVRVLLAHGADPNIVDDGDMTVILCAACTGGTTVEMFKALTASGGDINHQLRSTGDTALHIAVKLDDQQTALSLLSLGGDIMRVNNDGLRPIDCTTSTRLQFEIKRAAGNRDVMISYTHSHKDFALKLRKSLEDANITTWLDLMDPSGIGGGAVWREEIARGITNAAVVLCILTDDYTQSEWCLKELALAKQVGTPIMAISTENAKISEELQVYLYTRQIVPFEAAITSKELVNEKDIWYTYDEEAYKTNLRLLLDGLRDMIEKRREDNLRKNAHRSGDPLSNNGIIASRAPGSSGKLKQMNSVVSNNSGFVANSMKFDERALSNNQDEIGEFDSTRSNISVEDSFIGANLPLGNRGISSNGALSRHGSKTGMNPQYDVIESSRVSSASSATSMNDDFGTSDSIYLDTRGYYFHQPHWKTKGSSNHSVTGTVEDVNRATSGSIMETFDEVEAATASGEQFVFICHGDYHGKFVRKLCIELCRQGGLRCYLDRRHYVSQPATSSTTIDENQNNNAALKERLLTSPKEDMSRRIHEAKEAILKCSAFIVIISEKTLVSELVKDQLAFAEDKGKKLLPVVVNPMRLGLDMKYSLSRSEFYHFFTNGDMVGFDKSLQRILDELREELYGISIGYHPSSTFNFGQMPSFAGSSRGRSGSRSGNDHLRESGYSSGSFHSNSTSTIRRRRGLSTGSQQNDGYTPSGFGLPPTRLSQSFISNAGAAGPVGPRSITSDMSLSHSMIGNFSSMMGRITDEMEEEEDEQLSYAGIQDDDDHGSDSESDAVISASDKQQNYLDSDRINHVIGVLTAENLNASKGRSHDGSNSSISILEQPEDGSTYSIDVMPPSQQQEQQDHQQ